jgi:hypothetical protein
VKLRLQKLRENRHTVLMWFWIAMVPVTLIWLKESVLWVALMSLYSNIEASAAANEAKKNK